MDEQPSIIYRINSRDEIVFVNDLWNEVALANNNLHLLKQNILGRTIWEFISDHSSRALYKEIVKNIRSADR